MSNKVSAVKMSSVILPNTTLCTIVFNEMVNPAGGIADFVHSVVPFVEQAVTVDTGSNDGTYELLEQLKVQYPHLEIKRIDFTGYAQARNVSLHHAQTQYAFVLDADERLSVKDIAHLYEIMQQHSGDGFKFDCTDIYPDGSHLYGVNHNPRLFRVRGASYKPIGSGPFPFAEILYKGNVIHEEGYPTGIPIKHFLPSRLSLSAKRAWYHLLSASPLHARQELEEMAAAGEVPSWKLLA